MTFFLYSLHHGQNSKPFPSSLFLVEPLFWKSKVYRTADLPCEHKHWGEGRTIRFNSEVSCGLLLELQQTEWTSTMLGPPMLINTTWVCPKFVQDVPWKYINKLSNWFDYIKKFEFSNLRKMKDEDFSLHFWTNYPKIQTFWLSWKMV